MIGLKRQFGMQQRALLTLQFCVACAPLLMAQPQAYRFAGSTRTSAIDNVPVPFVAPFEGLLSFDQESEMTSQTSNATTFVDSGGSLKILYDGFTFESVGGLQITVTRLFIPPLNIDQTFLRFEALMVSTDGTAELIDRIGVSFVGPGQVFPESGLPDDLDSDVLNGSMQITSPDLPPPSGTEPPRTGFISGSLSSFSRLQPCADGDLRLDWLTTFAAIIRQLDAEVFAGAAVSEKILAQHELASELDLVALALADCDFTFAESVLADLSERLADPTDTYVSNNDVRNTVFYLVYAMLLLPY